MNYDIIINKNLETLNEYNKGFVGKICAILKLKDENICTNVKQQYILVYIPSSVSIVLCSDLEDIDGINGYKFVSINFYIDRILNFDCNYINTLNKNNILFQTEEFSNIMYNLNKMQSLETLKHCQYKKLIEKIKHAYRCTESLKGKNYIESLCSLCKLMMICESFTKEFSNINLYLEITEEQYRNFIDTYNRDKQIIMSKIKKLENSEYNTIVCSKLHAKKIKSDVKFMLLQDIISNSILNGW